MLFIYRACWNRKSVQVEAPQAVDTTGHISDLLTATESESSVFNTWLTINRNSVQFYNYFTKLLLDHHSLQCCWSVKRQEPSFHKPLYIGLSIILSLTGVVSNWIGRWAAGTVPKSLTTTVFHLTMSLLREGRSSCDTDGVSSQPLPLLASTKSDSSYIHVSLRLKLTYFLTRLRTHTNVH